VKGLVPASGLELRIQREYFEAFRVERITPEPAAIAIDARDVRLRFAADSIAAGSYSVVFDLEPLRTGRRAAAIRTGDAGDAVTFTQFAYF
jgi:hypothetical protein